MESLLSEPIDCIKVTEHGSNNLKKKLLLDKNFKEIPYVPKRADAEPSIIPKNNEIRSITSNSNLQKI